MERSRTIRIIQIVFLVALLVCLCTVVYIGATFHLDDVRIVSDPLSSFSSVWYYTDSGNPITPKTFPYAVAGSDPRTLHISNVLPRDLPPDTSFCMFSNWQMIRLYLDGTLIDTYATENETSFGTLFGGIWWMPMLPVDAGGKTISLEVSATQGTVRVDLDRIFLGNRNSMAFRVLKSNLPSLLFACITVVLGFLCFFIVLWQILSRKRYNHGSFLHLGVFLVMTAIWVITDSSVLQFFAGNAAVGSSISFFTFILLPVPILLYTDSIYVHHNRLLKILCLVNLLIFFMNFSLYVFGVRELISTLPIVHGFYLFGAIVILFLGVNERFRYRNAEANTLVFGLGILCVSSFVAIYLFNSKFAQWYALAFMIGMFCFECVLIVGQTKRFIALMNEQTEVDAYKRLAYSDYLTLLGNRAAFETLLESIYATSVESSVMNALLVIDMNDLKQWNDLYGHPYGDTLLKDSADLLQTVFAADGECFRIGGDEFAVIMTDCTEDRVRDKLSELDRLLDGYRTKHGRDLVLACGYAMSIHTNGEVRSSFLEWFKSADKKMYVNKIMKKSFANP